MLQLCKGIGQIPGPHEEDWIHELALLCPLNADRLPLHGSGRWDVTSLLSDELVMDYQEPRGLLAGLALGCHPKARGSENEVSKLAHM